MDPSAITNWPISTSPSMVPSICRRPGLFTFPRIVMSALMIEGMPDGRSDAAARDISATDGWSPAARLVLLVNIGLRLHEVGRVSGRAVGADLIVQMHAGGTPCGTHQADRLVQRHPVANLHQCTG